MYRYSERTKKIRLQRIIMLVIAVVIGVSGYFGYKSASSRSVFPKEVTKGLHFKLHYPQNLPRGYSVDQSSFINPEKGIVTFNINQPSGPAIGVAEQGVPPDLNLSQQSNAPAGVRLLTSHFSTPIGQATIDQWGDKQVCYIVAGQTWIILNVTKLKEDQIRLLARSFESIK